MFSLSLSLFLFHIFSKLSRSYLNCLLPTFITHRWFPMIRQRLSSYDNRILDINPRTLSRIHNERWNRASRANDWSQVTFYWRGWHTTGVLCDMPIALDPPFGKSLACLTSCSYGYCTERGKQRKKLFDRTKVGQTDWPSWFKSFDKRNYFCY